MGIPSYTQGKLDGLCGVYAFVNGYIHRLMQSRSAVDGSWGGDLSEDLFTWCLEAIPQHRYPSVIWEGLNVNDLLKVCRRTCTRIEEDRPWKHKVFRPFRGRSFRKPEKFFDALIPFHCEAPPSFIIIGLDGEPGHWVALREFKGHKIGLFNNTRNLIDDVDFSLRNGDPNQIVPDETIVVQLVSVG